MDASKTRHINFMSLYAKFRNEEHAGEPERGMLKLFSEKLGLSDRYLSHVKCGRKEIGHANARKIEEACGVSNGWLDQVHSDLEPRSVAERHFVETALAIFRGNEGEAQSMMLEFLKKSIKANAAP